MIGGIQSFDSSRSCGGVVVFGTEISGTEETPISITTDDFFNVLLYQLDLVRARAL